MTHNANDVLSARRAEYRAFAERAITPYANDWDRDGEIPRKAILNMAAEGYLGAPIPEEYGGLGLDQQSCGILHEEIGRACSSMRSLLTVHSSLTAETLNRWGGSEQKKRWLPALASGNSIAAFCLSEPQTGSDAANVHTTYEHRNGAYVLNGVKKWITFGQIADLFTVLARNGEHVSAFLVERSTPGIEVIPLSGMLGTRASMLAEIRLKNCSVAEDALLGRLGLGFVQIVNTALDNGRFSVACGSTGIARACLEESVDYAHARRQFGDVLHNFQLIKQKIAAMAVDVNAAQQLCAHAGRLRATKNPDAMLQTIVAKRFAAAAANRAANHAVQIHGALGCSEESPVQRFFRDARVQDIIEGTPEVLDLVIADQALAAAYAG